MKGLVCCLTGLLLAGLCSASPAGREFATSFMQNLGRDDRDARFLVEVVALPSSRGSTKVKVSAMGEVYEKEINPGNSVSFKLPDSVEITGSKKSHQTVLIEASQDVTVMSLNYKQYTADTSVIYPVKDWGTEYFIFTPSSTHRDTFKEFSITNYKEPNSVEIFLKGSVTFQGKYYRRGSKMTLKLEAFETVQIQSQDNLRGTNVVSRLPVAVSSGHSCAQIYTTCNHVYEQLLPVNSWGKEFIIAPLPYHDLFYSSHDSVFVQASQPTIITVNVNGKVQSRRMFAGQTLEFYSQWPHAIYLTSDKGIQVLFEFNGGLDGVLDHFDPFLMTILPTSHFSTSYSLEGQGDFYNYIIVVARNKHLDSIKIEPKPQYANFNWQKVDGTDFSWTEMHYSNGANFYQISHHDSPFGVYSFGVAYANGYGSPAAADPADDCSTTKCSEGEVCQMKENSPTCVKKPPAIKAGTCWAMGDPHYRTFDGNYYNFMGSCTYTMVKNCHVDEVHPAFEVDAQNDKQAGSEVTFVGKVIIKVHGFTVTIVRSEFGLVRMDHTLWNLPINLGNGKVKLSQSGLSVIVETDFGLTVQYDWKEYLVITVPGSFSGKVCGLCGNFNSKKEDDLMTPTGSQTSSVVALGKSWRVPNVTDDAQCRDECSGQCETCDVKAVGFFHSWRARAFCSVLTGIMDGPLRDCNAVIDPKVFHEICLFDICMGEGLKDFLCDSMQVYADACQRAGIKIYDWRRLAGCSRPSCPKNSHYEFCGNACPATCENPDAATKCKKSCVETCVCDEGFLLSGTECVHKAQCGCLYKDKSLYIGAGDSIFTDDCAERCTCNGTTKEVYCEKPGCRQGYECKVVDDLIGCHPIAYAECSMSAGPHFETFDGHNYNLQGTCVYQLAEVCSKDPSLQQFIVSVKYDARGKGSDSGAKQVEVKVYGTSIVAARKHKDSVLINGELTNLPFKLKRNFTVYQKNDFVEIKTEFGLQVTYYWNATVHVKVPDTYVDAMCGLCGNYNHNPKDDLQLKNGTDFRSCGPAGNGTCTISGDPHYKAFNNHTYDFQGTCTYTAAKSCHLERSWLDAFSVVVENEKWTQTEQPHLSVAKLVAVEVYGTTLVLRNNQLKTIMVNGTLTGIPLNLNEGQVEVFQEGFHYNIITDFGLKVTYDMIYKVTVTVPEDYKDKTCGLCGSFNDIVTDKFELPDGNITKDIQTFGAAWKTGMPGVVCEDGCSGDQCPKCNSTLKKIFEEDCKSITKSTGSFAACHSSLNPEPYYRDCVYDVCMSQGDRSVLCNSISAYIADCQTIGVKIDNWRTPDFCPIKCPENSHYQICSETCGSPCPGLTNTISCPATCAEGCACNEGYYFSGTDCVAQKNCSCFHKGLSYKIGESVLSDNCQQRCNCTASRGVECEHFSCNVAEKCQVNKGILGCHPKQCQMGNEGSITLFDGTTGTISVMGAYEILTHHDESAPDWFRVVAKLQECTATGAKSVVAVYVYFNDLSVTVTDTQETWVNGKKVTLPSLPGNNIFVRGSEETVIIDYTSHFQLSFSNTRGLIVTVSDSMVDKLGGACDTFLPLRDTMDFRQESMQEYMATFSAQDFPSCEL
ncbi:IgGFc-binding protein-like [Sebastes umbrosus]|uniref:IgGFc-binding protein-like n=1 Tax=Sebastes umbrosus TaxID=72105 RepID=UPI0018A06FDD|nr:IgGFc-binding protein-like [Sebastes umbrosus]